MNQEFIHDEPRVILYRNLLSNQECDLILENAREVVKSSVFDMETKQSKLSDYRTSSSYYDLDNRLGFVTDRVYQTVKDKFYYMRFGLQNFETVQVQQYQEGQQYKVHYDYFNIDENHRIYQNDRIATMIIYLNDDFDSGETEFPSLNIKVKPEKGMGLYFEYKYIEELNKMTLHAGLPVRNGEKWIVTSWMHRVPFVGRVC